MSRICQNAIVVFSQIIFSFAALAQNHDQADVSPPEGLVNPICISRLLSNGEDDYKKCVVTSLPPDVRSSRDGFGRMQHVVVPSEPEGDGWTIFSTTDHLWERGLVEFIENTGGTGNFSRIVGLPTADIEGWFSTKAGDRCNDGNHKVLSVAGSLTYVRSATPFRLLNFESDVDWRRIFFARRITQDSNEDIESFLRRMGVPRPFRDYAPYDDINNSASSCVGYVVVTDFNDFSTYGVLVIKNFQEINWASEDKELNDCISDSFNQLMAKYAVPSIHSDYLYVSGDDMKPALNDMPCSAGNLNKWSQ